ncbi:MAG TPA: ATP synthase F1 subunit gamma [bacterium]|nr:ATP synthase F1 subunit gamma [bacterium]HPS29886.1 ATP synthase F1 subunit gamma [bacterium]
MAGLKEIRKRISSVKNTQKITRAMKMIAATKLRKAQNAMISARKFCDEMNKIIYTLLEKNERDHPLLQHHSVIKREVLIVVSGDKGLCGSFNANVSRAAKKNIIELNNHGTAVTIYFIGKKAYESLKHVDAEKILDFVDIFQRFHFYQMYDLIEMLSEKYTAGEIDLVTLIYNDFKSAVSQEVKQEVLFPITEEIFQSTKPNMDSLGRDIIAEPSPDELYGFIIKRHATTLLFTALAESAAAEFSARMNSMDSATKSAEEMVGKMVLLYNKLRQDAITKELVEIIGGSETLKE